ncbi:hypothetical protein [Sulfoacidibacillus thermotolerans]|nr:hypothetical protein [Sulfoacidibacillus thermotolerans]
MEKLKQATWILAFIGSGHPRIDPKIAESKGKVLRVSEAGYYR